MLRRVVGLLGVFLLFGTGQSLAQPVLQGLGSGVGCAGDVIALLGLNFSRPLDDHQVHFVAGDASGVDLPGQVLAWELKGVDPQGNQITRLDVVVPTAARSGEVRLTSRVGGLFTPVGVLPFEACPVVVGTICGNLNQGFVYLDAVGGYFPTVIVVYGYNLSGISSATWHDEVGQILAATPTPGLPPGMAVVPPPFMDALTVPLPSGAGFFDCSDSAMAGLELIGPAGPTHRIEVPLRKVFGGAPAPLPASFAGVVLPPGIRAGRIPVTFGLLQVPSNARWNLQASYHDPATGSYEPCTLIDPALASGLTAGDRDHPSAVGSIVGPGATRTFVWDSAADLPAQAGVTHLRLNLVLAEALFQCDPARWFTAPIAFDNTLDDTRLYSEDFSTEARQDPTATDADWDITQAVLRGTGSPLAPADVFGTGVVDVVLENNRSYRFDTDGPTLHDVTIPASPVDMLSGNPGAAQFEFHVRSLQLRDTAEVEVIGTRPLVIRCAGTGQPHSVVFGVDGLLDLSGQHGTHASSAGPGLGGSGGPGGGAGGDGASVVASAITGLVTSVILARPGEPHGGGAGETLSYIRGNAATSTARGGPGGGGGHGTPGLPGVSTQAATVLGRAGAGGPARGDALISDLFGGSGGGGGGAAPSKTNNVVASRFGGGGGGGGGALQVTAAGSILIAGQVWAEGGAGGLGSSGVNGAPAGGGSGGTILLSATGFVTVTSQAQVMARGGVGAMIGTSLRGGNGGDGRVRLEAGLGVVRGGSVVLSQVSAPYALRPLTAPVDGGSGVDGALHISTPTGTYVIDTDAGTIRDPSAQLVLTAGQPGKFQFTSLDIAAGIILRGIGTQPLVIEVQGDARIAGGIDVSGFDGGAPDYTQLSMPLRGAGGIAGPGGGHGGTGGLVFGGIVVPGEPGRLPAGLPANLIGTPGYSGPGGHGLPLPISYVVPAAAGGPCIDCPGGAGGGGGFGTQGRMATPQGPPQPAAAGAGGSLFGSAHFTNPLGGSELLVGGGGGAGGGGSLLSTGGSINSPGSGGGGGGGVMKLAVAGTLRVEGSAALLANGRAGGPTLGAGGRGGDGAGGGIVLVAGQLRLDAPGPLVDTGGPGSGGAWLGGNGRISLQSFAPISVATGPLPSCTVDTTAGRICPPPSEGDFIDDRAAWSQAVTTILRLGPTDAVLAGASAIGPETLAPLFPADLPSVLVRYAWAVENPDLPGLPGPFLPPSEFATGVPPEAAYLRVHWWLAGDGSPGQPVQQPELDQWDLWVSF